MKLYQLLGANDRGALRIVRNRLPGFYPRHLSASCSTLQKQSSDPSKQFDPSKLRGAWGKPSFNPTQMMEVVDRDNHDMRKKMRTFLGNSSMTPRYNIPLHEERDLALSRLKAICDAGFISVLDFRGDPRRIFTAHELTAIVDASTATKMTVQFNLFGGTVLKLGTERHHEQLLAGIDTLDDVGCFGLTELGYGNNAVEMETTATYDQTKQEFIVNSPTTLSQK